MQPCCTRQHVINVIYNVYVFTIIGVDIMLLLLALGCDLEGKENLGATPLFYAAASGCAKACGLLLSKGNTYHNLLIYTGANPNQKDKYEACPLLIALRNNHYETASTLLLFGADIHFKGTMGNSAVCSSTYNWYFLVAFCMWRWWFGKGNAHVHMITLLGAILVGTWCKHFSCES